MSVTLSFFGRLVILLLLLCLFPPRDMPRHFIRRRVSFLNFFIINFIGFNFCFAYVPQVFYDEFFCLSLPRGSRYFSNRRSSEIFYKNKKKDLFVESSRRKIRMIKNLHLVRHFFTSAECLQLMILNESATMEEIGDDIYEVFFSDKWGKKWMERVKMISRQNMLKFHTVDLSKARSIGAFEMLLVKVSFQGRSIFSLVVAASWDCEAPLIGTVSSERNVSRSDVRPMAASSSSFHFSSIARGRDVLKAFYDSADSFSMELTKLLYIPRAQYTGSSDLLPVPNRERPYLISCISLWTQCALLVTYIQQRQFLGVGLFAFCKLSS